MKTTKPSLIFLILLFTLCSACGSTSLNGQQIPTSQVPTAESLMDQPSPLPSYAPHVDPAPGSKVQYSGKVCVIVSFATLWEPGDSEDKIVNSLGRRVKLQVDGRDTKAEPFMYSGPDLIVTDKDGKQIGDIGTSNPCFDASLASGLHIATLQLMTTSGKIFSYTWAFRNL